MEQDLIYKEDFREKAIHRLAHYLNSRDNIIRRLALEAHDPSLSEFDRKASAGAAESVANERSGVVNSCIALGILNEVEQELAAIQSKGVNRHALSSFEGPAAN